MATASVDTARLMVFSADTHVGPHPRHLRPYCPQRYLGAYDEFVAQSEAAFNAEFEAMAFSDEYREGRRRNALTEGHFDPDAWMRDMDRDGVAGGVVFHDSLNGQPMPFDMQHAFSQTIPLPEARELAAVGRQMYNRWLADFSAATGGRGVALAQLPFWDLDAAIAELEWCAEHGFGGVNFPAPGQAGMHQPGHPELERFFAAAAALDMTLTTHIGASPPMVEYVDAQAEATMRFGLIDSGDWGARTVYQLVLYGVFERHPNLKLVLTEVPGVFWNEMCSKMDSVYHSPMPRRLDRTAEAPSEYLARNVWIGNSFQSRHEAEAAIAIGREDRFMWGSDYPHAEGTYIHTDDDSVYPRTRLSIAHNYHGLPLDKVRKLLGENAYAAFPRVDREVLAKVAADIGMSPDDLSEAPDLDGYPDIEGTGTLAFRTVGAWG
jgi:predicted TIM-barrel fold metal-dependent hydrolase